jgi:dihydrofolate reductase
VSKVVFDISMSLDGFITAAGRTTDDPMGTGGLKLVEWAMSDDEVNRRYLQEAVGGLGSVICGRETYDTSVPWWGANGPSGEARRPVFVVTHEAPDTSPDGGVYQFVTGGIHDGLDRARAAAEDKVVCVMGGANLGQQYLAAGLVDEISLHVAPVVFGTGTRLFDHLPAEHLHLETLDVVRTPTAIHTRLRVVK